MPTHEHLRKQFKSQLGNDTKIVGIQCINKQDIIWNP